MLPSVYRLVSSSFDDCPGSAFKITLICRKQVVVEAGWFKSYARKPTTLKLDAVGLKGCFQLATTHCLITCVRGSSCDGAICKQPNQSYISHRRDRAKRHMSHRPKERKRIPPRSRRSTNVFTRLLPNRQNQPVPNIPHARHNHTSTIDTLFHCPKPDLHTALPLTRSPHHSFSRPQQLTMTTFFTPHSRNV